MASEMRYADPSHEIIVSEPNSFAIVAESVEVIVLSFLVQLCLQYCGKILILTQGYEEYSKPGKADCYDDTSRFHALCTQGTVPGPFIAISCCLGCMQEWRDLAWTLFVV